jgi:predicted helicase
MSKIFHAEIFGLRESKYDWLIKHNIKDIKWNKLKPNSEFYLFIPQDQRLQVIYQTFNRITEVFPVNSVGVVTSRDNFVIDFDRKKLEQRIKQFIDPKVDEEILKQTYDLSENQSWKIKERREKLRKDLDWKNSITKILYRPFDERWILYHDEMIERSRKEILQHLLHQNLALLIGRQGSVIGSEYYNIVFISEQIVDLNLYRRGGELVFPLYLYPEKKAKKKGAILQMMMFEQETEYKIRQPNINHVLFEQLKKSFKKEVSPEEILYYIYALLYSNTYRTKYAEFLEIDFPRIPFTTNYKLFIKLGKLGQQLAALHLLKSDELNKTVSKFPLEGDNKVVRLKYEDEKVWINDDQYFDGVKEEVWKYQIGGYQVCEKWLKDRKGRTLTIEEIQTYCKVVTALYQTMRVQNNIDTLYPNIEETL